MKLLKLFSLAMLILLSSCKNQSISVEENFDPNVNLESLSKLKESDQRIVVSGLRSNMQIASLFQEKLKIIISERKDVKSESEIALINELIEFLNSETILNLPQSRPQFESFINDWYFKSINRTNWEPEMYTFLLGSLETDYSKFKYDLEIKTSLIKASSRLYAAECECSTSGSGIVIHDCGTASTDCDVAECDNTSSGCGALWMSTCDGNCDTGIDDGDGEAPTNP